MRERGRVRVFPVRALVLSVRPRPRAHVIENNQFSVLYRVFTKKNRVITAIKLNIDETLDVCELEVKNLPLLISLS